MRSFIGIMKIGVTLLCLVGILVGIVACSDDYADKIEGKWQLRHYELNDGTLLQEDSVFYNFQKGVFSAIYLLSDGNHLPYFGNYSLSGDTISIILQVGKLENVEQKKIEMADYLRWDTLDMERNFILDNLTGDKMVLRDEYVGETMAFRKY